MGVRVSPRVCGHVDGLAGCSLNCVRPFAPSSPRQTLLDMVENYPTALRSLVLAENSISPELQQQICDLLSEGEEEEELAGGAGDTQEPERGRGPAAQPSWMCPGGKSPRVRAEPGPEEAWDQGGCVCETQAASHLCPWWRNEWWSERPSALPQNPALRWCS